MSRDEKKSAGRNYSIWIVLAGVAVTALLGYSFFSTHSWLQDLNADRADDMTSQLQTMHPDTRIHATNYLELSDTYHDIAETASSLETQAEPMDTDKIVAGLNRAAELKNAAEMFPELPETETRKLTTFSVKCQTECDRMNRELGTAKSQLPYSERQRLESAESQLQSSGVRNGNESSAVRGRVQSAFIQ